MNIPFHIQERFISVWDHRREPEYARVLAHMYWTALVTISPIFVIVAIGFSWWSITAIYSEKTTESVIQQPVDDSMVERLRSTLAGLDARMAHYNAELAQPTVVKDPAPKTKSSATSVNLSAPPIFSAPR